MRGTSRALTLLAVAVLSATVAASLVGLGDRYLAARLGGAAVAAIVAIRLLDPVPGTAGPGGGRARDAFEAVWWRGGEPTRAPDPPERERLGGMVRLAMGAAGDAHDRLRPLLRELADARMDAAYGTHVDRDPLASARLGPATWDWVRPERRQPADRLDPGPDAAELDAIVVGLERLDTPDHSPPDGRDHAPDR